MAGEGGKKTILIIDDEASMRNLFTKMLSRDGYKVFESSDGEGGLKLLSKENIDLLLLDLRLPGIQGMDVLRRIRKEGMNVPVIVITGYGSDEGEKEAKGLGIIDYVHKPFSLAYMKDLIKETLEGG